MVPGRNSYHKAQARSGQTILIHGASGAVGLAAIQMAQSLGLRVLGTAGSDAGKSLISEHGAESVFDHHDADRATAILNATQWRGVDIVLEMLANANLALDLELLAPGGRVVVVGNRGEIAINPRHLMVKEAAVYGMILMNTSAAEIRDIHAGIAEGLKQGTFTPIVGKSYPLEDAAQPHRDIIEGPHLGKVVLLPVVANGS